MVGGTGGIIYLLEGHWHKYVAGVGRDSNNMAELKSLRLTLHLANSKGLQCLQVFGDSRLLIDWFKLRNPPKTINLKEIFKDG